MIANCGINYIQLKGKRKVSEVVDFAFLTRNIEQNESKSMWVGQIPSATPSVL